jgi:hypothetical protein
MSVRFFLKTTASKLNLFYNFKLNKKFSCFEVVYTYIYIFLFIGICSFLGYLFFQSTHMSFQCEHTSNSDKELLCANDFVICVCEDEKNIVNICRQNAMSSCICCSYGQIAYKSGILLFLTHIGGLYTFTIGVSLLLVGVIRNYILSRGKESTSEIEISEINN